MTGIYIHVPFCLGKCPYCDFYSCCPTEELVEKYMHSLREQIQQSPYRGAVIETIYFGGGTPNVIGAPRLVTILETVKGSFGVSPGAEIAVEVNPGSIESGFFDKLHKAGFNRISMGMQSANEDELRFLGRKHKNEDVTLAVKKARQAGFENISLDLMLALPGMDKKKIAHSVAFAASLEVQHVSAYMLKIEQGTPFYEKQASMVLPDEDETAELYSFAVDALQNHGFAQYEISNFAKPGYESKHNLLYWKCEEYVGFGPAAHSFYEGKRFYCPPDLDKFIEAPQYIEDETGGGFEEYVMLALRLNEGISRKACTKRFSDGNVKYNLLLKNTKKCPHDLIHADSDKISLTKQGFLASNAVILALLGY